LQRLRTPSAQLRLLNFSGFGYPLAGSLKLDPLWDELRNDPRFDKIIAGAAEPAKLD